MAKIDPKILCLVVSIERATERRASISRQLNAIGLPFEFVNGIDVSANDVSNHPEMDYEKGKARFNRDILPAEMACSLAHARCYQTLLESDATHAMIFEDDATLNEGFKEFIADGHYARHPFIMLNHLAARARKKSIRPFFGKYRIVKAANSPYMCVGYTVDRKTAERLLAAAIPAFGPPDWPIPANELGVRVVLPFLVGHPPIDTPGQSLIGTRVPGAYIRNRKWSDYFTRGYWHKKYLKHFTKYVS